jgi:NTE family protein
MRTMVNPLKYFINRNVGIALGSGGAKGIAQIAIIEYLEAMGIRPQMIAGASAGALVGGMYACGSLWDFKRDLLNMEWNDFLRLVDPVLPRSGLVAGEKAMEFLSGYIPASMNIEDLPLKMRVWPTDYASGDAVVISSGSLLQAVRASISMPGVFTPVRYGDYLLIDGGVANPVPVDIVREMGAGLVIAVNLHPSLPPRLVKKKMKEKTPEIGVADEHSPESGNTGRLAGWWHSVTGFFSRHKSPAPYDGPELPSIVDVMMQTLDIMELQNTQLLLRYHKPTVLIEPQLQHFKTLDFAKVNEALGEGYVSAKKVRPQLVRRIQYWV